MNLIKSLAWVVAKYTSFVVMGYIAIDAWVMGKARTEAYQIEEKVMAVRASDMLHIDKRLDRIDAKLDVLIKDKR